MTKLLKGSMHAAIIPAGLDIYATRWWSAMAMNGMALLIAFSVVLAYQHNRSPLDLVLVPALAGLAALPVVAWKRYRLIDFGHPEKPSLATALYALLAAIGVHAIEDQTLLDRWAGLWAGVIIGLSLGALILWFERPTKILWASVATGLLIFASWGMTQVFDCLLDNSPQRTEQTLIERRYTTEAHCRGGARSTPGYCTGRNAQYVALSPVFFDLPSQLSVDGGWYSRVQLGDPICVVEGSGRFGARWYRFDVCPQL
jgi:hypothetical protein